MTLPVIQKVILSRPEICHVIKAHQAHQHPALRPQLKLSEHQLHHHQNHEHQPHLHQGSQPLHQKSQPHHHHQVHHQAPLLHHHQLSKNGLHWKIQQLSMLHMLDQPTPKMNASQQEDQISMLIGLPIVELLTVIMKEETTLCRTREPLIWMITKCIMFLDCKMSQHSGEIVRDQPHQAAQAHHRHLMQFSVQITKKFEKIIFLQ